VALPSLTLTGTITDASGTPLRGTLTFQPNAQLSYTGSPETDVPQEPVPVTLSNTGTFTVALLPCDAANVSPAGWSYVVNQTTGYPNGSRVSVPAYQVQPTGTGTIQFSSLTKNPLPVPSSQTYVPLNGGTMTGPLVLSGDPTTALGAVTKEYVDDHVPTGIVTSVNEITPVLGNVTLTASTVGALSITGNQDLIGQYLVVGPTSTTFTPHDSHSAYYVLNKNNTSSDASWIAQDQGAVRLEHGLVGDNNYHVKLVTGTAGNEQYHDAFVVFTSSLSAKFFGSVGVGTVPVAPLHVAGSSTTARVTAKLENTNLAGGGTAVGVQFNLVGNSVNFAFGTDVGLNGGNNLFFVNANAAYMTGFLVNAAGQLGILTDSPQSALDVNGAATVRGDNGLTASRFRGRETVSGPPTSGTWVTNDLVLDSQQSLWLCTNGGTPGTWVSGASQRRIQAPTPVLNRGRATVITTYAAGHGWTANGFASSNVNDTSGGRLSGQMLTGTTTGNIGAFPTFTKTGASAVNLTGNCLRVWIMVDVPTNVDAITLRVAGTGGIAGNNYLSWTALAASGGTYRTNGVMIPPNTWTELSFSLGSAFTVGSPATTAITEYRWICQDLGTAFTAHFGGIEMFPATTSRFPNGVVCIGFDDCYAGQYNLAMNLMSSFGYPATIFPIIDQIGAGGSFTLTQLQQMVNIGWEVAPHASTLANHTSWNTLTQAQIAADVNASQQWIASQGFGLSGAFAYPLGGFNGGISATVAPLCSIARTIDSTMYTESSPVGNVLQVRSAAGVGGTGGIGISTYTTAGTGVFALAKAAGALVFITIHDVSSGTSGNINQISIADLTTLVTAINTQGLACTTFGEVLKYAALGT